MKRLIIFLIRRKLGLKKWQDFRFSNQKSETDYYFFGSDKLYKVTKEPIRDIGLSNVSLNWLLDDNCEIIKF